MRTQTTPLQVLFFTGFFRKKHGRTTAGRIPPAEDEEETDNINRLFGQVMPKEIPESTEWRAQ